MERSSFEGRHIGPRPEQIAKMLALLGYESLEDLISATLPAGLADDKLRLPAPISEAEVLTELRSLANRNQVTTPLIGMGYYGTQTPSVVRRRVLESPAWYTAYTPYQPEISQGRLEALLNFQTLVCDLTGLAIANSSLLDEPTAAAEAMALSHRVSRTAAHTYLVDSDTHPQTIAVLRTRAEPIGIQIEVRDLAQDGLGDSDAFGVLFSYPTSSGNLVDPTQLIAAAHDRDLLVTAATDLLALTLLRPPGEFGADICVGSAQRLGVPMGFGGPHAGFMSLRSGLERSMPGRLVGVSVDETGRPAYRLALQTREQHIRRERATSNICTAQVLLAVVASSYAVYHGPEGLREIAERAHSHAHVFAEGLRAGGIEMRNEHFFDTVAFHLPGRAEAVVREAERMGVGIRLIDRDTASISTDELTDMEHVMAVWQGIASAVPEFGVNLAQYQFDPDSQDSTAIPVWARRESDYLRHPVFSENRSETEMLRYLRRLSDRDISLDRSMIPLGSCTMKLNAATAMEPISWPGFAEIHPFAPMHQATGYRDLIGQLEAWLAEITGFDAVSVQPNAGSQGELAGLLAIRAYHRANGDDQRDICLIPSSAHGTNAASAVMAGMKVQVVACTQGGDVDAADLARLLKENAKRVAALMITYPSTHGVFEENVAAICELVHQAGAQVYVDGANLNALVGVTKLGSLGADVSHLNLHKTFTIPHGGGGPGVGPVGVKAHLAPYLPSHPLRTEAGPVGRGYEDGGVGPVSGAPWGSAGVLPIPWAYIRMMGGDGLRRATEVAILNANYIAKRLEGHFDVLYRGKTGLVAHECIIDVRPLTKDTGITVDDVAKRLIDYGFHAPTMSFPVAGTFMIEPTESEGLAELDRFCDAMISIRAEIADVAEGRWSAQDSPLRHAPHTAESLVRDWDRPYSREMGVYPAKWLISDKFWPTVGRIDQAFGDRNLVCQCPPVSNYADDL
ncbi:aminomethyl-transferring glycine dehydrogenase [Candidatus Nanopelagicales bacterium]|nr:aminomethyl-transferring glycine dehydrogenase [Candidatus Nanopelagicales bacterium]